MIITIDEGTTSTRALLIDQNGKIQLTVQKEIEQHYPQAAWVEHDANEIWQKTLGACRELITQALKIGFNKEDITGIAITNQRETSIIWDPKTGKPIHNAIVWQCRRTSDYCNSIKNQTIAKNQNLTNYIKAKTGLEIDAYFSATKVKWILDNIAVADTLLSEDKLLFGTIDTWVLWKLTEGRSHLTEATNASRTMLYDIKKNIWSDELLKLFNIPKKILPEVKDSADHFGYTNLLGGKISIGGIAGDQQAATIGQACFEEGSIKSTYGTGCFMLMNTGSKFKVSKNNLLSTIVYRLKGQTCYALEGSIFIAGAAVQWLRDSLKMIKSAEETEELYTQNDKSTQIYLVPAFVGLGAPYWDGEARGAIFGMTRNTGIADFVKIGRASCRERV